MLNITVAADAAARLKSLLKEEGGDACVRVREAQVGTPCKRQIVLRLSIDECEYDDVEGQVFGLSFVASPELIEQYGKHFAVSLNENKMPVVSVAK